MQDVPFDLTWPSSQNRSQCRWQGFYSSLPIISSRELYSTHLATNEALLCTCRKWTFHTSTSRKCPHTLPFTIETWQARTPSVWMECILTSHTRHAECSRMKHVVTHNLQPDVKMGSVEWITPSTLAIPVMRYNTRIKHVAHLVWLCKKVSLT
jgi:hypothetical protein